MLDLKSFVVNGELIIDKPHWYQLKNSHDRQELKDAISDTIDDLDLPLVKYTEQEAKEDFYELAKFDARTLLTKDNLYTNADYKYELSHWYIKNSVIGRNWWVFVWLACKIFDNHITAWINKIRHRVSWSIHIYIYYTMWSRF